MRFLNCVLASGNKIALPINTSLITFAQEKCDLDIYILVGTRVTCHTLNFDEDNHARQAYQKVLEFASEFNVDKVVNILGITGYTSL